jgi:hypothetical protein
MGGVVIIPCNNHQQVAELTLSHHWAKNCALAESKRKSEQQQVRRGLKIKSRAQNSYGT